MGAVELCVRSLYRHEDEDQQHPALGRGSRDASGAVVHAVHRPRPRVVVMSAPVVTELHGPEGLAAWAAACPDFEPAVRALVNGGECDE